MQVFVCINKIVSVKNYGTDNDIRGAHITQASFFSYRTLEDRITKKQPLRKIRPVEDDLLASMKE
jgi:hypothetical protein